MAQHMSLHERADELERKMSDELDVLISKSALFNMADGKLGASGGASERTTREGKYYRSATRIRKRTSGISGRTTSQTTTSRKRTSAPGITSGT